MQGYHAYAYAWMASWWRGRPPEETAHVDCPSTWLPDFRCTCSWCCLSFFFSSFVFFSQFNYFLYSGIPSISRFLLLLNPSHSVGFLGIFWAFIVFCANVWNSSNYFDFPYSLLDYLLIGVPMLEESLVFVNFVVVLKLMKFLWIRCYGLVHENWREWTDFGMIIWKL